MYARHVMYDRNVISHIFLTNDTYDTLLVSHVLQNTNSEIWPTSVSLSIYSSNAHVVM